METVKSLAFTEGFRAAVNMWTAGTSWEDIKELASTVERKTEHYGMLAAVEAMSGWVDSAERMARLFAGMTRTEATAAVRHGLEALRQDDCSICRGRHGREITHACE